MRKWFSFSHSYQPWQGWAEECRYRGRKSHTLRPFNLENNMSREIELEIQKRLITRTEDLIGLTIAGAYINLGANAYIRFDDDRFCILEAESDYCDGADVVFKEDVCAYDDFGGLTKAGVITQQVVDDDREARRVARELDTIKKQRAEYEKLKLLFDNNEE
jgi:hypothetical protein